LPTHVTEQARERDQVPPVTATIGLPDKASLVTGYPRVELGQLAGRSGARSSTTWWGHEPGTPDRALVEWVVQAPDLGRVEVSVSHPRAGVATYGVELDTATRAADGGRR
jgi:hypothetical protein